MTLIMSISARRTLHFEKKLWIVYYAIMKVVQLKNVDMGNILKKILVWFELPDTKSRHFLIYQPTTMNQKPIMMSLWF